LFVQNLLTVFNIIITNTFNKQSGPQVSLLNLEPTSITSLIPRNSIGSDSVGIIPFLSPGSKELNKLSNLSKNNIIENKNKPTESKE
jgi:hypothetical protein